MFLTFLEKATRTEYLTFLTLQALCILNTKSQTRKLNFDQNYVKYLKRQVVQICLKQMLYNIYISSYKPWNGEHHRTRPITPSRSISRDGKRKKNKPTASLTLRLAFSIYELIHLIPKLVPKVKQFSIQLMSPTVPKKLQYYPDISQTKLLFKQALVMATFVL